MIYIVDGKPARISYSLLDEVVLLGAEYLKLPKRIKIEIIFEKIDDIYQCGYSDIEDGVAKMWVNSNMPEDQIIATILHEMVHIQQMKSKKLVIGNWPTPSKWCGEYVIANYLELPWEVEAYRLEEEMLSLYNERKKSGSKSKRSS